MAAVYRARHRALDKDVALKVLHPEVSASPDYVARFVREARAAARIDHPNVVRIQDAGESRGRHYIAMELVEGVNLERAVRRDGPLSELAALEVALGVGRALEAAHELKLVHRDVKPANIVRTPDGRVKLLDLGLARAQHRRGDDGYITDHGRTLGTPFYVSPEQARGEELDIRSDIYSLGVTLFHLVTGDHPFTGPNAVDVMRRHIQEAPPSPRRLRPQLSAAFERLVLRMLAKKPGERFDSPRELCREIEAVRASDEEEAAAAGRGGRERGRGARERRGARAAGGAGDGGAAGRGARPDAQGPAAGKGSPDAAAADAKGGEGRPPEAKPGAERARAAPPAREAPVVAPPRTPIARLTLAALGLALAWVALLLARGALGPPVSAAERARAEEERARRAAAPPPGASPGAGAEVAAGALPGEWPIVRKRAEELIEGGDFQGALVYLKRMVPLEKRAGALAEACAALEGAVARALERRFKKDLAHAAEKRREGHYKMAETIYRRILGYGGSAERARAEQLLETLDAEAKAAAAAAAAGPAPAGEREREALEDLLREVAAHVRSGQPARGAERLRALARSLGGEGAGGLPGLLAEGAKLVEELALLDEIVAQGFADMAGKPVKVALVTGAVLEGTVRSIDKSGRVTLAPLAPGAPIQFLVASLSPPEKERVAMLARGRGSDVERLLVIQDLYGGARRAALERAERLGAPGLLEHAGSLVSLAGEGTAAEAAIAAAPGPSAPASAGGEKPAAKPAPKPPAKPAPPPRPASTLERLLTELLRAPVEAPAASFRARYALGAGHEPLLEDWRFERQPFRRSTTERGLFLESNARAPAKLLHKVPLATPFALELRFTVEQKGPGARVSLLFAEGRGGSGYAVECGEGVFRRLRGENVQDLRKPAVPPPEALRAGASMTIRVDVDDEQAKVIRDGKTVCEKVKVRDPGGLPGIEVQDATVTLEEVSIEGLPDPVWYADEMRKLNR
jgi:hypothetical protein